MRSLPSDEFATGRASAASPGGAGAAGLALNSAITARAAIALAKRLTRREVEEVHAGHLDAHRHALGEPEARMGRELRDEVRPRRDDALLARRLLGLLLVLTLA